FIHVDIDESEMGKNVKPHIELVADARLALEAMLPHIDKLQAGRGTWLAQIDAWREEHPLRYRRSNGKLQPQDVLIDMYRRTKSRSSSSSATRTSCRRCGSRGSRTSRRRSTPRSGRRVRS